VSTKESCKARGGRRKATHKRILERLKIVVPFFSFFGVSSLDIHYTFCTTNIEQGACIEQSMFMKNVNYNFN
jgi:hypothetical protein